MIRHIAIFTLHDSVDNKSKEENVLQIHDNVRKLQQNIPQIVSIEFGTNLPALPSFMPWDVSICVNFENKQDFEIYMKHPVHIAAAAFASKVSKTAQGITFENSL